jgi:hypothetical protein
MKACGAFDTLLSLLETKVSRTTMATRNGFGENIVSLRRGDVMVRRYGLAI